MYDPTAAMQKGIKTLDIILGHMMFSPMDDPTAAMQKGIKTLNLFRGQSDVVSYDPTAAMQKGIKTV